MSDFRADLARARIAAGVTQAEMGRYLGFETRSRVAHIEQGLWDPPLSLVERWLEFVGLRLHTVANARCPVCGGLLVSDETAPLLFAHTHND